MKKRRIIIVITLGVIVLGSFLFSASQRATNQLLAQYVSFSSPIIHDRNGDIVRMQSNASGYYSSFADAPPKTFTTLLTNVEDKYFAWHPGINPISSIRGALSFLGIGPRSGGSTITQQLTKILLQTGEERTLKNKVRESLYALALELSLQKDEILTMYANVAYFGGRTQGITEAARVYFDKYPSELTEHEQLSLVATLKSPSRGHPGTRENNQRTSILAAALGVTGAESKIATTSAILARGSVADFEISTLNITCTLTCRLTIDNGLTKSLRDILVRHINSSALKNTANGAIVVLKLPENELLAIVGSPDPTAVSYGYQINMALEPRPIGSTAKPFIYLKGFEKGLRPYTLVDDREYKFPIGSGFSLYPKNYDYKYRGNVSLHDALSNSLNVPTVKVLEHISIDTFNEFLTNTLNFTSLRPIEEYELGIALGTLEMDLLTLTHLFSLFPNEGILEPLTTVFGEGPTQTPMTSITETTRIAGAEYVALINAILSDRLQGVEQFGLKSNLSLPYDNYAVKTGTSREFHDSWTIGYTPDFVVGVWVGNADDSPLDGISGQTGAGAIWHDVMQLLLASKYSSGTTFDLSLVEKFQDGNSLQYGLHNDDIEFARRILLEEDNALILEPHDGDVILFDEPRIQLRAKEPVTWTINNNVIASLKIATWEPHEPGIYQITANTKDGVSETITVEIRPDT